MPSRTTVPLRIFEDVGQVEGPTPRWEPPGQATTDAGGRLFVSVPMQALEAELTVFGREPWWWI